MKNNARDIALKYLSSRDRTAKEIEKHLKEKGCTEEEIVETINFLIEEHFIDDDDFCRRYILYGIEKGRGPLRLERELVEKGVSAEKVRMCLCAEFDREREQELASELAHRLLKNTIDNTGDKIQSEGTDSGAAGVNKKSLARIARRLASQGYHTDIIYEVIGKLGFDSEI